MSEGKNHNALQSITFEDTRNSSQTTAVSRYINTKNFLPHFFEISCPPKRLHISQTSQIHAHYIPEFVEQNKCVSPAKSDADA